MFRTRRWLGRRAAWTLESPGSRGRRCLPAYIHSSTPAIGFPCVPPTAIYACASHSSDVCIPVRRGGLMTLHWIITARTYLFWIRVQTKTKGPHYGPRPCSGGKLLGCGVIKQVIRDETILRHNGCHGAFVQAARCTVHMGARWTRIDRHLGPTDR